MVFIIKIKIKRVRIEGLSYKYGLGEYLDWVNIDKITSPDKPSISLFYCGNNEISREEAISIWKKFHDCKEFSQEVKEFNYDSNSYCEKLEERIDKYTLYIENTKQMEQAEKNNANIREKIKKIKESF